MVLIYPTNITSSVFVLFGLLYLLWHVEFIVYMCRAKSVCGMPIACFIQYVYQL